MALSCGRRSARAMSGSTRMPPMVVIGSVLAPTVAVTNRPGDSCQSGLLIWAVA